MLSVTQQVGKDSIELGGFATSPVIQPPLLSKKKKNRKVEIMLVK